MTRICAAALLTICLLVPSAGHAGQLLDALIDEANHGDVESQFTLGYCYEIGDAIPQDYGKAFHWYAMCAKNGDIFCQDKLARFYDEGKGVAKDPARAFHWHRMSAENPQIDSIGDAAGEIMFNIGVCYYNGEGTRPDKKEARAWFGRACEHKYADGCKVARRLDARKR